MTDQLDLFTYDKPKETIIRCKDCQYFEPHYKPYKGNEYMNCMTQNGILEPYPEGYCSYAKKKV